MNNEHKPKPRRSPWRIHRLEKGFEIFWRDDGDGVESYTYVATARQHSNARLIAAAPELLAEIQSALATAQDGLEHMDSGDEEGARMALDVICSGLEDAINNATKEEA